MNIEEAKLYLEHTSKDDFNLEEWQKENRYQAIQVVLKEIERLNNIIFNQGKRNSHQRIANADLQDKNEELSYIINELEKWLKECKDMCAKYTFDDTYECEYNYFQQIAIADFIKSFILNKLQELKGSDKE